MFGPLSIIGGFFIRTLLWLIPAIAIWFWFGDFFSAPISWLAGEAMTALFPGWVYGYEIEGSNVSLHTTVPAPNLPAGVFGELAPEISALKYGFGLPLLAALLLASRACGIWWKLPLSALLLLPFQAWGICLNWLRVVGIQYGRWSQTVTYFTDGHANLIGLGYQVGYLILPMLIPVMLWFLLERHFFTKIVFDGALAGVVSGEPAPTDECAITSSQGQAPAAPGNGRSG